MSQHWKSKILKFICLKTLSDRNWSYGFTEIQLIAFWCPVLDIFLFTGSSWIDVMVRSFRHARRWTNSRIRCIVSATLHNDNNLELIVFYSLRRKKKSENTAVSKKYSHVGFIVDKVAMGRIFLRKLFIMISQCSMSIHSSITDSSQLSKFMAPLKTQKKKRKEGKSP